MTTFPFKQPANQAFQFQPTLDGQVYSAIVTWNLFGRRYYLNLLALDGTLVLCTALAGSPTPLGMGSLTWQRGFALATTLLPHGHDLGSTYPLTVSGCVPTDFNGVVEATATGPMGFKYPLSADPGMASVLGAAGYDLNLVGGVINESGTPFASTLVFRQAASQFEANP